ncbi:uncharacterized protein LOC116721028 [Xiphophorus hellerii]|uniref:uncharacterized protein LOC116721028 n=1 Tax=Xiphophorus hellerii TaxID=8084 RepID=UPI0013B44F4E|nr:uncharacterized protein LOC116721028 [Xiphophorus hellerii]
MTQSEFGLVLMGRPITRLSEGRSSTLTDFVLELKSCCVLSVLLSVPGKTMQLLLFSCMMMIFCLQPGSSEDLLTPFKDDQLDLEGNDVTLSCNYSGTVNLLLWYRQTPSSSPQLVTSGYSDTTGRLSLRHEKTRKTFHLLISSAAVTDSAVYYCAVEPTVTGNTRTLYKNLQYSTAATRGPHSLLIYWLLSVWTEDKDNSDIMLQLNLVQK